MKYRNKLQIISTVFKHGGFAAIVFAICKIVTGLLLPLTAYVFQNLIDLIITSFQTESIGKTLSFPILMIVGVYILQAVEEPIAKYCDFLLRQKLNYLYEKRNIEKLTRICYSHFENSKDLDLVNRISNSAGSAAVDLFDNILNLAAGMIKIMGTFILLIHYSILISIVCILVAIPLLMIAAKYGRTIHEWYQVNSKNRRRLGYISSLFIDRTASHEIKAYNHYDYLNTKWKGQFKDLREKDFKLQLKAWKNTLVSAVLLNLFEYITYAIILIPTMDGFITIGAFIGLSKAIASIERLIIWDFSSIFTFFARSKEYWNEYNDFCDLSEMQVKAKTIMNTEVNTDDKVLSIEFRKVFFRYENMETDVLHDVSFILNENELCGLVGINGAGKSTLTKLMLGLYLPNAGDIFINGINTKDMLFEEQVQKFSVTYQDFCQYNVSLLDNIGFDLKHIEIEKVKEVLRSLHFDYEKLPFGINTMIGRRFGDGVDISGGEWQKIALARMLSVDTAFYVMDEPTASLDPISEMELYKQIQIVLRHKTALLITHRLGATVLCDKIMVLDGGKITEAGTFSELIERGGAYAKMYKEQKQWYVK